MLRVRTPKAGIVTDRNLTKTLDREMGRLLRRAVKAWLEAVLMNNVSAPYTDGDNFPIKTGQAKSSLKPVAAIVRRALPISPAPGYRSRVSSDTGQVEIIDDKTNPLQFVYFFTWQSNVPHFLLNEDNARNYPYGSDTPWKSIKAGGVAFNRVIKEDGQKILRVTFNKLFQIKRF